ncbi:MAG: Endo,4-beta-xylanase [Myxococcales bacterium]|nr:Endo,4-beta-xylanase [Myxococcales bacterium]
MNAARIYLFGVLSIAGCVDHPANPGLHLTIEESSVKGTFVYDGAVIELHSQSFNQGQRAVAELDIDGRRLEVTVDLAAKTLIEDAKDNTFGFEHRALLLALRDAAIAGHPELMESLEGSLLVKIADRYAEVPIDHVMTRHFVDLAAPPPGDSKSDQVLSGCGPNGVTCLPGESGTSWAVFSAGGVCRAEQTPYGDAICRGRCGVGCNWLDNDYTWDCLDHDVCLDYSSDCNDEFNDAADDWIATVAPLCFSGTARSKPPSVPVPKKILVSLQGNKCLDVAQMSPNNGAITWLWDCHAGGNQQWTYRPAADGTVQIVVAHSGKCLEVSSDYLGNGARVQQWDCWAGDNQKWEVRQLGTSLALINKASGRCLDVENQHTENGAKIQVWDCYFGANQQWRRE